jgi:hypothetical protein
VSVPRIARGLTALTLATTALLSVPAHAEEVPPLPVGAPDYGGLVPDVNAPATDSVVITAASACDGALRLVFGGRRADECSARRPENKCHEIKLMPNLSSNGEEVIWRPQIDARGCYVRIGSTITASFTWQVDSSIAGRIRDQSGTYEIDSQTVIRNMRSQWDGRLCTRTVGTYEIISVQWTLSAGGAFDTGSVSVPCN